MAVPFIGDGRAVVPPMLTPLTSASEAGSKVMEPFFEAMITEIQRGLEQSGILQRQSVALDEARNQTELLKQVREALTTQATVKYTATERAGHLQQIQDMNLPEAVRDTAINFLDSLGLYGEELQQQAIAAQASRSIADKEVSDRLGLLLDSLSLDEETLSKAQEARRLAHAGEVPYDTEQKQRRHPYADVVDVGEVSPGDKPSTQGHPEGKASSDAVAAAEARNQRAQDEREEKQRVTEQMTFEGAAKKWSNPDTWRQEAMERAKGKVDTWATNWSDVNRPKQRRTGRYDDNGNLTWDMDWVDPEAGAAYERQMQRVGRVQDALDVYSEGGGVSGAIAKAAPGAAKYLGAAGAVWGTAQLAAGIAEQQRQANAPYTQVYGAGQMDAYGQRLQEWGFSNLSMLGTMNSQQASQLYQSVAATGWRDQDRQAALEFGVENYKRFGMDVGTSMQFVEMATNQGVEALDAYRKGLIAVAEDAKKSGESIKEAQQAYAEALRQAQNFSSGEGAAEVAALAQGIDSGLASTPLAGLDWVPLLENDALISQAAIRTGQTRAGVQAGIRSGDVDTFNAVVGGAVERATQYGVRQGQVSSATAARIDEIMQAADGESPPNEMVEEVINLMIQDGALNPDTAAAIVRDATGLNVTEAQALQFLARSYLGDPALNIEESTSGTTAEMEKAETDVAGLNKGFWRSGWTERDKFMKEWGLTRDFGGLMGAIGMGSFRFGDNTITGKGASPIYDSAYSYFDMVRRGDIGDGRRSANMESIYAHVGGLEADKAKEFAGRKFFVVDEDGQEREVSFDDLPKYYEQVEAGTVQVAGTDGRRSNLRDVIGYTPRGADGTAAQQQTVKVEVEAKGALKDVLTLNQVGGAATEQNRLQGRPGASWLNPLSNPLATAND